MSLLDITEIDPLEHALEELAKSEERQAEKSRLLREELLEKGVLEDRILKVFSGLQLRGEKGPRGPAGPQGQHGKDGRDGKDGKDGQAGARGLDGKPGLNGRAIYTGESKPTGEVGDLFINPKTGDLFEKTSVGWQLVGNLKGPKGRDGQDGPPGPPGPRGPRGPSGGGGIGVLPGGTTGQVLAKKSSTDFDTEWINQTGGGAVSSVSNSDGTLTISPTTGAVVASLNLNQANTWTQTQSFQNTDSTYTPQPPTSANIAFDPDISTGFQATGNTYRFYIYAYYFDGVSYAHDATGIYVESTDPNDSAFYSVAVSWSGATDANGYILYDFNLSQYVNVGATTSYTVTTATSWTFGSPPSSPTSITVLGVPVWLQPSVNWAAQDATLANFMDSAGSALRLRWLYLGSGGYGGLRFEDGAGVLKWINANTYGENAYLSNQLVASTVSTTTLVASSLTGLAVSTKQVTFSQSGALSGDAGFEYDWTTNRLLIASASLTAQSKLHIDSGTGQASDLRFTAGSTTGQTSSDGFQVGITSAGVAELRQRENLDLDIYTNNTRRASFPASGGLWQPASAAGTYWSFRTGGLTSGFGYSLRYNDAVDTLGYGAAYRHALQHSTGESFCFVQGTTPVLVIEDGGDIGIGTGTAAISPRLQVQKTSEQARFAYDASNYLSIDVSSTGVATLNAAGSSQRIVIPDFLFVGTGTQVANGQMQVSSSGTQTSIQFTTTGTGYTSNDGFYLMYLDGTGVRYFNFEATDHVFYISGSERVRFANSGAVLQITATLAAQFSGGGSSLGGTLSQISTAGSTQEWRTAVGGNDNSIVNGRSWFVQNVTGSTAPFFVNTSGDVGIGLGSNAASARLHLIKTTEQLRVGYNTSNYFTTTVSSAGAVTFDAVGASAGFAFSDAVTLSDVNLVLGTTTGTKIGTATTQKIGLWNATPIVQPTTAGASATRVGGGGAALTDTDTFDGYTLAQVVKALRNVGLLA